MHSSVQLTVVKPLCFFIREKHEISSSCRMAEMIP